jgi:hypothetical protein
MIADEDISMNSPLMAINFKESISSLPSKSDREFDIKIIEDSLEKVKYLILDIPDSIITTGSV